MPIDKERLQPVPKLPEQPYDEPETDDTPQQQEQPSGEPAKVDQGFVEVGENQKLSTKIQKVESNVIFTEERFEDTAEEPQKPLIEELSEPASASTEEKAAQQQPQVAEKDIEIPLQAKTQETNEKFFLIINVPGYEKEHVQHLIFDRQVQTSREPKETVSPSLQLPPI